MRTFPAGGSSATIYLILKHMNSQVPAYSVNIFAGHCHLYAEDKTNVSMVTEPGPTLVPGLFDLLILKMVLNTNMLTNHLTSP